MTCVAQAESAFFVRSNRCALFALEDKDMAAIAKFVSHDGGIAFSDSMLKIQKRDEERGRLIPLDSITGIEVNEPLLGDDGYIRVQMAGKRPSVKNTIYFDEEQYDDAVSFKAAFDSFTGQISSELPPLEMFQPTSIAKRLQREQARYSEPERQRRPVRQTRRNRRFRWWYAVIAVIIVAILATPGKMESNREQQESMAFASMEPTETPQPTAEPTPEPTPEPSPEPTPEPMPFVEYTSPPEATAPPATQQPQAGTTYVLNTSTMKFHSPSCRDVGKINAENRQDYMGTRDEVIAKGYSPCGHCHP